MNQEINEKTYLYTCEKACEALPQPDQPNFSPVGSLSQSPWRSHVAESQGYTSKVPGGCSCTQWSQNPSLNSMFDGVSIACPCGKHCLSSFHHSESSKWKNDAHEGGIHTFASAICYHGGAYPSAVWSLAPSKASPRALLSILGNLVLLFLSSQIRIYNQWLRCHEVHGEVFFSGLNGLNRWNYGS